MEQFANNADSTLNGAINNSTTSIVVANGSSFPSVGDFRLIIGSDPDTAEYVLATARSGNTITVVRGQEGSSPQSWVDGTTVTHILTKGAVEALRDTLKGKTLHSSLETISNPQDGYALTWINIDGYWAARPGSPFTVVGNELSTTGNITAAKYSSGTIPLTTVGYSYVSDANQSFTVPAGVTSLKVKMWGPGGGTGNYSASGGGGAGGYSTGFISVTPGEQLILVIGSGGKKPVSTNGNGGLGGWPGGGYGTRGDASGGGGGGYSGIFTGSISQANAIVIAGGGGGASGFGNYGAGGGGGLTGGSGVGQAGKGGSQVAGGLNGNSTSSPAYTVGGMFTGGVAFTDNTTSVGVDCGGGGSGYWGGGAGQGDGAAGGGGSGFLHATRITSGATTAGANAPSGATAAQPANITDINYVAGVGLGGAASGSGNNGGDGYIVFQWGGLTSFDNDSIDLANGSSITILENNLTISPGSNGTLTLSSFASGTGGITLASGGDVIVSSGGASKYKIYSSGAVVIGDAVNNDTSAEAQAGLAGALINISAATGTATSISNQALVYNIAGVLVTQGHSGVTARVGTTDIVTITSTGATITGETWSTQRLRLGALGNTSATITGSSITGANDTIFAHSNVDVVSRLITSLNSGTSVNSTLNTGAGGSATIGLSIVAAGTTYTGIPAWTGNATIEQVGATTSSLLFSKVLGNGTSRAVTGRIWQSGAWTIGDAANNDTSAEAQAGLTGPLINLSPATGTFTSTANQALNFNIAGAHHIQGNTEVRFDIAANLAGYFDSNRTFRIGPSASSSATTFGGYVMPTSGESMYGYNASGDFAMRYVSGSTSNHAFIDLLNTAGGASTMVMMRIAAGGTASGVAAWAGNGFIEQGGSSTSCIAYTATNNTGGGRIATGRMYQSGAWCIGDATINDTSAEAQAGLTGPLLNITQITGGSLTSIANQSLHYNSAGVNTLQGHVGHALIANTTTVASTSTTKFITNVGRRVNTVVTTTSLGVSAGTEVIIVGAIASSVTITLPSGPTAGDIYTVKDQLGNAATKNIIISGNGNNIDDNSSYTMNANYQSITVIFANGSWSVI